MGEETKLCVDCERAFLAALDGNCRTPIAGQAKIVDGVVTFKGLIAAEDGTEIHRTEITGSPEDVVQLGTQAGLELKERAPHLVEAFLQEKLEAPAAPAKA